MVHVNSYLQLPVDGGGKKIRALQTTIGSDNVYSEYLIALGHDRQITNVYAFTSAALVVGASADGANVGRVYIENDPDSTVLIAVRSLKFKSQVGSVLATPTSPRIVLRTFTFTGNTPSGTAVTGSKKDSAMTTKDSNWNVRTADTGMTITEVADIASFFPISTVTAVGNCESSVDSWSPGVDSPFILRAGQGLMIKQADNGTTSDTRRFTCEFEIEEFVEVTVS